MKKNFHKFIVFGVLLFSILGCSSIMKSVDGNKPPQVIFSTDSSYQLTVPGSWTKQFDLNKEATLQAANPRDEVYAIVIQENKGDFPKGTTVDTVTNLSRDNAKETIINPIFSVALPVTINGFPARQFEVTGTVSGHNAKYLYAVIETPGSYYQILTWTLASKYTKNKPELEQVINSFKETK